MKLLYGATARYIVGATLAIAASAWWLAWPSRADGTAQNASDADDPALVHRFTGRVTGPDGRPFEGAKIYVPPNGKAPTEIGPVRAETGVDGRFEFDAPDMTFTAIDGLPARRQGLVIATAEGYAPDWFETWGHNQSTFREFWHPVKGDPITLQLANEGSIHGRFVGPDGEPLAGARVELTALMIPEDRDLDAYLKEEALASPAKYFLTAADWERQIYKPRLLPGLEVATRTDAKGRFRLSGLGADRLARVKVTAPMVADATFTVMSRDADDVPILPNKPGGTPTGIIYGSGFTVGLQRGLTVTGVVRDRDTHAPVPGMWISRNYNPLRNPELSRDMPVTDDQGRFSISGLKPALVTWKESHRHVVAYPQPGVMYHMAQGTIDADGKVLIECVRGIPYRLKLVDERGQPVEADISYQHVSPNPHVEELIKPFANSYGGVMNRAARRADGSYEGFVLPGPGAVLVKTPGRSFRPPHVDPKAFFAPGRTDWSPDERNAFGTHDTLATLGWIDQHDYAAIVLVNPPADQPADAPPLQLTATVIDDKPRRVSLVDANGQPVVGAKPNGMMATRGHEPRLRTATFSLTKLHPDRIRRMTFIHEDRQLIGFLLARGDGETPYRVQMQPWAAVTGQLVDGEGRPMEAKLSLGDSFAIPNPDPEIGHHGIIKVDKQGVFRIDQLVPGQRYAATVRRGNFKIAGMAFENLILRPGEVRDLGVIRIGRPLVAMATLSP